MNDIHSSDLTASCLRAVKLRHEGKIAPEYTTALYRGQLAGEVLRLVHERGLWGNTLLTAVNEAHLAVVKTAYLEGRLLTEAVTKNGTDIQAEVLRVCELYQTRFADYFSRCKLIGCELPIRAEIDGRNFASHLDLLFRDPEGALCVWDWKWRADSPMFAYLARNLQFGMYALSVRHGSAMLADDEWVDFGEWPRLAWLHLPYLLPYGKATGDAKKGDLRPLEQIVRWLPSCELWESNIRAEFNLRASMMEQDFWPTNPDPIGCGLCESQAFCPAFVQQGSSEE